MIIDLLLEEGVEGGHLHRLAAVGEAHLHQMQVEEEEEGDAAKPRCRARITRNAAETERVLKVSWTLAAATFSGSSFCLFYSKSHDQRTSVANHERRRKLATLAKSKSRAPRVRRCITKLGSPHSAAT